MKKIINSFWRSFRGALEQNEYVLRWQENYPRFFNFFRERFSLSAPYGFYFSYGILLSAALFAYFIGIVEDVLTHDPFVEVDVRIMNLIVALRSVQISKVLLLFTYLGNWEIVVSLGAIIAVTLWLSGERWKVIFFSIGIVVGELIFAAFKLLFHRTRPDLGLSLITRDGYAFPSGHAVTSVIFYGMIGFGIFLMLKKWWQKALTVIFTLTVIFLIGFSRMYLGVHWLSDVAAGWTLGFSLLIFLTAFFGEQVRLGNFKKNAPYLSGKIISVITALLLALEVLFICYFYAVNPLRTFPAPKALEEISAASFADLQKIIPENGFPKFSESLTGQKMEPMNFIIVGTKENLSSAFLKIDWFLADGLRIRTLFNLVSASLTSSPYPNAPVTPSFLNSQPENLAFEKPTADTIKQRHHVRFWQSNFDVSGVPVWVGTASYDEGLRYYIAHRISPDIDTEREFIMDAFLKNDLVKEFRKIQLVKPVLGQNQTGDQFFTNGEAYLMLLK